MEVGDRIQIGGRRIKLGVVDEGIGARAGPAGQGVRAQPASQQIVVRVAFQDVIVRIADQRGVAGAGPEHVVGQDMLGVGEDQFLHIGDGIDAIPVGHRIGHRGDARSRIRRDGIFRNEAGERNHVHAQIIEVAAGAVDGVVAETGGYGIAAYAAGDVVIAVAAIKCVVAALAVEGIVAFQTIKGVVVHIAFQGVVICIAGQRGVAGAGPEHVVGQDMLGVGEDQFLHIGDGIDAIPAGHRIGHRGNAGARIRGDRVFGNKAREGHHVDAQIIDRAAGAIDGVVAKAGDYGVGA